MTKVGVTLAEPAGDLLNTIIGAAPGSALAECGRSGRTFYRHTQGSHDVLLSPDDQAACRWRNGRWSLRAVAELSGHAALTRIIKRWLRPRASLRRVRGCRRSWCMRNVWRSRPAVRPRRTWPRWTRFGLSARDIVALAQLVAFVAYQVRAAVGLVASGRRSASHEPQRFTLEAVEWDPWLTTGQGGDRNGQAAARQLDASPQANSPYFRTAGPRRRFVGGAVAAVPFG